MPRPVIAITMGDAAGVGPEIIMKSLAHADLYERCRPVVVGDGNRLRQAGAIVGGTLAVRSLATIEDMRGSPGNVDCIDLHLIPDDLPGGNCRRWPAMPPTITSRPRPGLRCRARWMRSARRR
jgi:hypothetical protein